MLNIISAFGLAGSAGVNAYIPLFIVALAAHYPLNDPFIKLQAPYDAIGSWWAIMIIAFFLIIEMLADKVPAVDTINDGIQTFIRPAAGALLFAASANILTDIHPALSLTAGLLTAGSVHAVKSTARPVVTAATGGTGNWAVSLIEDVTAVVMTLLAIFVPALAGLMLIVIAFMVYRLVRRWRRRRNPVFA